MNFGIIYGMSDYGLSQQLDIPVKSAKQYIERYHEVYPNISQYMDKQIEYCTEHGYVSHILSVVVIFMRFMIVIVPFVSLETGCNECANSRYGR